MLEEAFQLREIQKFLPRELPVFARFRQNWALLMRRLEARRRLTAFVGEGSGESALEELRGLLSTSRRLLDQLRRFVSHKRSSHALFYFLSDRDLLSLLVSAQQRTSLALVRLFPALEEFHFD